MIKNWPVTPQLDVALDDSGTPVLIVPEGATQVTVTNIDALKAALDRAREWAAVVYPPPAPGRAGHSPVDRSLAFTALLEQPGYRRVEAREGERLVTEFLADWHSFGHIMHRSMIEYAKIWWEQR